MCHFARNDKYCSCFAWWKIDFFPKKFEAARDFDCSYFLSAHFIGESRLVERHEIYRWDLAKFFDYFEFLPRENFKAQAVLQDKNIITAVGFAHQAFARKVLLSLDLVDNADNYFKERNQYPEEDLMFTLSEEEFAEMKHEFENTLWSIFSKI